MMLRVLLSGCLVILGLMRTVSSNPVPPVCPTNCELTTEYSTQYIRHISDLGDSSVAPWSLQERPSSEVEDELDSLRVAVCKKCTVENMVAKPIYFEIAVFKRVHNGSSHKWCKCPYKLAVGCTCVMKG